MELSDTYKLELNRFIRPAPARRITAADAKPISRS
jgi:hypothetical protein